MKLFELYPLPEHHILEHPNWLFDTDSEIFIRAKDLVAVRRDFRGWRIELNHADYQKAPNPNASINEVLDYVDTNWPCPPPPILPGQVWSAGTTLWTGQRLGTFSILSVTGTTFTIALYGELLTLEPAALIAGPAALVYGPQAPWVSPDWRVLDTP